MLLKIELNDGSSLIKSIKTYCYILKKKYIENHNYSKRVQEKKLVGPRCFFHKKKSARITVQQIQLGKINLQLVFY